MSSVLDAPHFHDEAAAYAYVEARVWPNGRVCPHCGAVDQSGKHLQGKRDRIGLYKCYACRKPFTVKIGTVFEASHIPLHVWLQAMFLMASSKKGISSHQLHRTLGITLKSAWFLSQRIREAMADGSGPLGSDGSPVEIDETWIGGLEENKHANKRHFAGDPRKGKTPILALVERQGRARAYPVADVNGANLRRVLHENIAPGVKVYSDEAPRLRSAAWPHPGDKVNHHKGEYVRGDVHTNTVEGYFAILKRGIIGTYHHVSEEHLHRYLAEFSFRYSNRKALGIEDVERADNIVKGAPGKRLTYRMPRGETGEVADEWPPAI